MALFIKIKNLAKKLRVELKNWPEAFVTIDLWVSEYPRREHRLIKILQSIIRPATLIAVRR